MRRPIISSAQTVVPHNGVPTKYTAFFWVSPGLAMPGTRFLEPAQAHRTHVTPRQCRGLCPRDPAMRPDPSLARDLLHAARERPSGCRVNANGANAKAEPAEHGPCSPARATPRPDPAPPRPAPSSPHRRARPPLHAHTYTHARTRTHVCTHTHTPVETLLVGNGRFSLSPLTSFLRRFS